MNQKVLTIKALGTPQCGGSVTFKFKKASGDEKDVSLRGYVRDGYRQTIPAAFFLVGVVCNSPIEFTFEEL